MRRLPHGRVARLGRAGPRRAALVAQQVEPGHGGAGVLAEPVPDVEHRPVPVAEPALLPRRARQLDRRHQQLRLQRPRARQVTGQPQPDARAVRAGRAAVEREQAVVDLHDDLAARLHPIAGAFAQHGLAAAGRPRRDPGRALVQARQAPASGGDAGAAEAGPAVAGRVGVELAGLRHVARRHPEQDRVVHDLRVLRKELAAGDVRRRGQLRVDEEAAVLVGAARRRVRPVRARHGQRDEALARAQRAGRRGCAVGRVQRGRWLLRCGGGAVVPLSAPASSCAGISACAGIFAGAAARRQEECGRHDGEDARGVRRHADTVLGSAGWVWVRCRGRGSPGCGR